MFRNQDANMRWRIGYGFGDSNNLRGYTEPESYSEWISAFRKSQHKLRNQLPLINITQSQFDALSSLYFQTGEWRRVLSTDGTYDLYSAIKGERWLLVADMIANGMDRSARINDAKILLLGDYSVFKGRTDKRREGIQFARNQYIIGIKDSLAKKQAEFAYYRQTGGAWLPNVAESRQRMIINMSRE